QVASQPVPHRPWVRGESVEFLSTVALGVLILAAALLYVWQHTYVVGLGYEVERLRERQAVLVQEHKGLRLELGQLRSLRRVEEIARTRLGMGTPRPGQVILMPESTIQ
ncbi:MAG: cell division protein FtsL, partial [Candidatus Methylomirabilota bacterium]